MSNKHCCRDEKTLFYIKGYGNVRIVLILTLEYILQCKKKWSTNSLKIHRCKFLNFLNM